MIPYGIAMRSATGSTRERAQRSRMAATRIDLPAAFGTVRRPVRAGAWRYVAWTRCERTEPCSGTLCHCSAGKAMHAGRLRLDRPRQLPVRQPVRPSGSGSAGRRTLSLSSQVRAQAPGLSDPWISPARALSARAGQHHPPEGHLSHQVPRVLHAPRSPWAGLPWRAWHEAIDYVKFEDTAEDDQLHGTLLGVLVLRVLAHVGPFSSRLSAVGGSRGGSPGTIRYSPTSRASASRTRGPMSRRAVRDGARP
jgi:hypothetical protein